MLSGSLSDKLGKRKFLLAMGYQQLASRFLQ
jgi:hypothetical protein